MLGPSMVAEWPVDKPDFDFELAKHNIDLFYKTRLLFYGDYYPLTPYSVKKTVWLAYQFHRDDWDKGVIFAFRRSQRADSELTVKLDGLQPEEKYELENVDTGDKQIYQGSQLSSGLKMRVKSTPGSAVLLYSPVP